METKWRNLDIVQLPRISLLQPRVMSNGKANFAAALHADNCFSVYKLSGSCSSEVWSIPGRTARSGHGRRLGLLDQRNALAI